MTVQGREAADGHGPGRGLPAIDKPKMMMAPTGGSVDVAESQQEVGHASGAGVIVSLDGKRRASTGGA
jgi:hypothetical protein